MTRVPFGETSSRFMLAPTIGHHLNQVSEDNKETAELLKSSLYVDEFLTAAESEEEAIRIYKQSNEIVADGGMLIRKWSTNSDRLQKLFDSNDKQMVELSKEKTALPSNDRNVFGIT
ncbi:hypothetical protein HPB48_013822 [Haemaphysalis longicornis]|uniref:Reverse transcriptase domain-containing protein n=1 Tax=Haemaphysalis longicornis TaxID=44386 RepID=A0A9J6FYU6_HAELO|nr:hypothetical protein HPB48_013822 [Haemaphysalis longicornis]